MLQLVDDGARCYLRLRKRESVTEVRAADKSRRRLLPIAGVFPCPAWKKFGTARMVKPDTVIVHSRADDVVPFANSKELAKNCRATLIEVGTDYGLADPEPLAAMLKACEGEGHHRGNLQARPEEAADSAVTPYVSNDGEGGGCCLQSGG